MMDNPTVGIEIDRRLDCAWKNHMQEEGCDPTAFTVLVARPDAWLAIKAMGLTGHRRSGSDVVYYTEIVDGKKRRAFTVIIGKDAIIKKLEALRNKKCGMTFEDVQEAD